MLAKKVCAPVVSASIGSPLRAMMESYGDHRSREKFRHCNVLTYCVSNATGKRSNVLREEADKRARAPDREGGP